MNAPREPFRNFSDVSYDEALNRARAMVPILRQRASTTENARTLADETIAELNETGLMRFAQPKRWGGMEFDFVSVFDIPLELARGCASTAWVVGNLAIHHWMLALYDERAQQEVWAENPDAGIASGIAFPQGSGRKVDGGYIVSGNWNFSSGVNHSTWEMLAATIREGEKVVDHRMCLVPKSDYEVVDDWHVLGVRGSGSCTVRAKDIFVPEHRALCMYDIRGGSTFPGAKVNPNPTYRVPLVALGTHCIAGSIVGNAMAAVELTIEVVKERSTSYTAMKMRDFQAVQLRIAQAASQVDMARLSCRNDCLEAQAAARSGRMLTVEEKLRYKRNVAYAATLCTEAVDSLHALAGANGIYDRYPIQRIFRDQHAMSGHIGFSWDMQATPWGLVALGGDFVSPTL